MIIRKKKKPLLIIILAASLMVVVAAAVILATLLRNKDEPDKEYTPPELIDGEALFNGSAVAYAQISESNIDLIRIEGGDREYALRREDTEDGSLGSFLLYYADDEGKMQIYYPAITEHDPMFEYDDVYATVSFGDYGDIPILTYLCVAIGTTYFDERIELSEYVEEQNEQLSHYGLSLTDDYVSVSFRYTYKVTDEEGNEVKDEEGNVQTAEGTHKINIGEPLVTGGGYYFTVDGRPYVYSTTNNYFDYAMLGFTDLINPVLVAAGLPEDGSFEPYLTTGYKHWKNEVHEEEGKEVPEGATVIVDADVITSVAPDTVLGPYDSQDGYLRDGFTHLSFDLDEYSRDSAYSCIARALVGKKIGAFENNILITLPTYSKSLKFTDGVKTVGYKIVAIEAIVRDGVDNTEAGTAVNAGDLVKVTYYLTDADGHYVSYNTLHAVIDTSSELLPEDVRTKLLSSSVGALSEYIEFTVDYTETNSVLRRVTLTISEIIKITDGNNATVNKVANGTTVVYRYYVSIDGERAYDYIDRITVSSDLEGDSRAIADALMGKTCMSGLNAEVVNYTEYCELMADFITYEIREIDYFVTKRMIVSFEFEQASDRDPYYGESLYKNTTENENRLYALNASSCEAIIKILGGLGENTSSSTGLIGTKTVAIGLTPDVLKQYGLYAYTVYFELPRGITSVTYGDSDQTLNEYLNSLDDYTYYSTLGFTLYISEEVRDEDGTLIRYIASDMYDIVSKVPAENFVFLKYEFAEFYARRNLVLTDVSNIKTVTVEFMMEDLFGKYINELTHTPLYAYEGKLYTKDTLPEGAWDTASEFDGINVFVTPVGLCTPNALIKYINDNGYETGVSLYELYGKRYSGVDTLGTAYFKEFMETLFYTYYSGTVDKTAQEEYLATLSPIMRLSVTLGKQGDGGSYVPTSSYDYVYEFYRYSDGCVMVRVYRQQRTTGATIEEVSDFYITLASYKKLVSAYCGLLDAKKIDNDLPYATEDGANLIFDIPRSDDE